MEKVSNKMDEVATTARDVLKGERGMKEVFKDAVHSATGEVKER